MKKITEKKFIWPVVILAVIIANFISFFAHRRLDLTSEQRFTISRPVKDFLEDMRGEAEILVFLKGNLPSGFRKLSSSASDVLQEFQDYSRGKITFKTISANENIPGTNRTYADTLTSLGVIPINLTVQLKEEQQSQYVFPAALVKYEGRWQAVELYKGAKTVITPAELNTAEALLEYHLADALLKAVSTQKALAGYATGNGEPMGIETYDLVENVLKKDYELFTVNLQKEPFIPDTFKVLVMVKPSLPFNEQEKLKIDQYIMRGGKLLLFIDRLEAEMDSLQIKNEVIAYDRNLQLNDLLFKYGARVNPDLLMDLQSDFLPFNVSGGEQFEFLHWNYFPLFASSQNNLITKNLGLVSGRFVNTIDTVAAEGIKKTILLTSSNHARSISTPALISGAENRNAPVDAAFNQKDLPVAVLLEGKFSSLYRNRLSTAAMDTLQQHDQTFYSEGTDTKIIVVADGDIPLNATFQGNPLPMGVNPYTVETQYEYQFANRQFVENCLEYLVDNAGLMVAKSKDYQLRLLDSKKVDEQRALWQVINLAGPVILVLLIGVAAQLLRKRKYKID